ncbi:hypothetical protein AVEN_43600-1 [Araneus ventricosus]|uniref:Uncharacterized protein n=1 Tax=Araneus ventricosus TaxID=182803 RepID=A0A4Y2EIC6_ARAVE|nr:hypothetical protein AVEN_43600-1 [Araneus ventricosus]
MCPKLGLGKSNRFWAEKVWDGFSITRSSPRCYIPGLSVVVAPFKCEKRFWNPYSDLETLAAESSQVGDPHLVTCPRDASCGGTSDVLLLNPLTPMAKICHLCIRKL